MTAGPSGILFNIMRFATHDGPGIRTTVFFKGCPLSCAWCHNPESQSFRPERLYFQDRCRHCLDCASACPQNAIQPREGVPFTSEACDFCGVCTKVCAADARQIAGRRYTVAQAIAEIEKDAIFFDESGGGVTLSGGEPLAQPAFAMALLQACRERGIGTIIETCGFAREEVCLEAALLADRIFFDLKFVDPEKHRAYTGVDNDSILANLKALLSLGLAVTVRIPVVPGINDTGEDIRQFADCLANLRPPQVELLPYHTLGAGKYDRLGRAFPLANTPQPAAAEMERFREHIARAGLTVTVGG
jgi:pyruvate formate lyase activating enzyme